MVNAEVVIEAPMTVREQIKTKVKDYQENCMHIGRLLHTISTEKHYKTWGYATFEDYLREELAFEPRKAYYHISIWDTFGIKFNVPEETIKDIGWSKAAQLATLANKGAITEGNVSTWIDTASTTSSRQLAEKISQASDNSIVPIINKNSNVTRKLNLSLYSDQFETVDNALKLAKEVTGSDKQGHLVETICMVFLTDYNKCSLENIINFAEKTYNVKLEIKK